MTPSGQIVRAGCYEGVLPRHMHVLQQLRLGLMTRVRRLGGSLSCRTSLYTGITLRTRLDHLLSASSLFSWIPISVTVVTTMSVEFGSVPFPDSPIDEYFQKRYSPYRDFSPPSSAITSPILDEEKAMMKLQAIAERQSLESSDESVDEDGLLMSKEASAAPMTTPLEYTISPAKKLTFLGLYFLLNIALTISNKHLLVKVGIMSSRVA